TESFKVSCFNWCTFRIAGALSSECPLVDRSKFSGNYKGSFEKELSKLQGAIESCENLEPNRVGFKNEILILLSSYLFWSVLVVGATLVATIAYNFGESKGLEKKYDQDKQFGQLKDSLKIVKKELIECQNSQKKASVEK
ncbi:hypothetical protein HX039_16660, partial [Myroides marinus]|uniref:hypothetical protein n=1 Tax=Myroides marinus TaxID=703342 RepID=UPI0025757EA1